jgi:hypothetical protein
MDFSDPTPKLPPVISREHVERLLGRAYFFIWEPVFTFGNRFLPLPGLKALENQMRPKSKQEVKMEKQPTLENLINSLPPIISRDHVEKYLVGVISKRTLANLDSAGKGPKRMRIGRKIAYRTEDLLEWL